MRHYFLRFWSFHKNIRLFIYATFLFCVSQAIFNLVCNLYILKLGYTREFLGTLESIPIFVVSALTIPLTILCAGLPMKRTLLAALALAAFAYLGMAVFPSRSMLIFFKFMFGLHGSFLAISSWPLMAKYSNAKDLDTVFSFQFSLTMAAGFLGNLSGGWLTALATALLAGGLENPAAYRFAMISGALLAAAAMLPIIYFEAEPEKRPMRTKFDLACMDQAGAMRIFLPQLAVGFGAGMIMPYLNIFFKTGFSLGISNLGSLMSLMPLSMAVGGIIGPWLAGRQGHVRTMIIFQALSVPFLVMMAFSGDLYITVAATFIRTLLMNASWPVYSVFMLSRFRKESHRMASAVYCTLWNLLWASGAKLSGALQMDFGFDMPFLITIVCYCAATLMLSHWFLREESGKAQARRILTESME